ncbi:MAG: hypothetical protein D6698_16885 [Gammaproteobacteria bacterium]|nr:MAG: hypothetical protein D6698_16885 [Gammaproteobacteria bacterium]
MFEDSYIDSYYEDRTDLSCVEYQPLPLPGEESGEDGQQDCEEPDWDEHYPWEAHYPDRVFPEDLED